MRIALCKSYFSGPQSGADEVLVSYATLLHKTGHEVEVILSYKPSDNDQYYKRLQAAGVTVPYIIRRPLIYRCLRVLRKFLAGLFFFLFLVPPLVVKLREIWQGILVRLTSRNYGQCREHLARRAPDLLHVFTPDAGAALMIRVGHELNTPVLYHEMGTPHYLPPLETHYQRLAKVLPLCSEVAALSPSLAAQWRRKFPFLNPLSVLPLTSECPAEEPAGRQQAPGFALLVFGFTARMEEGKGPLLLLEAFAKVLEAGVPSYLRMVGTGPQLHKVRRRAKERGLLERCDFISAWAGPLGRDRFLQSLDVFILPTLAEGTPKIIVEAMANGRPVVASAVGGIPDMLTPETGVVVPPADVGALAEGMLRLAREPELRACMGRAARDRYLALFSHEAVLPVLLDTCRRVSRVRLPQLAPSEAEGSAHPWHLLAHEHAV